MPIRVPLVSSSPLVPALFVARPSQFLAEVRIDNRVVLAHTADHAALDTLLYPGVQLLLATSGSSGRKTTFQVVAVHVDGDLVSLDALLSHRLVAAALEARALPQFARYPKIQPEMTLVGHQFDFRLGESTASCLIKVESVWQIRNGVAVFPIVPTMPGCEYVELLTRLVRNGQRAAIIFVVQRSTGRALVPDDSVDPSYARMLRQAIATGVEVYAYRCLLTADSIHLGEHVPVYGSIDTVATTASRRK